MKRKFTKYPIKAGRYSDVVPYEKRRYWYFTTHGYGPGSLPKDVTVLETREGQNEKGTWGDYICVDSVLNTDELREYDLRELAPEDVKRACGKKQVKASADEFGPFARSDEDTAHDAEIRHKLIYDAGLDPDVVSRVSTSKAQELYDYYCEGEGKCMRGPYPSEYGDFDEVVMESTNIAASVNAGDGDGLASAIEQTLARNGVEISEVICFDDDLEYGIDISVETTPNDDEYYVASVLEDAYPDAHVEVSDTRACTIHLHWDV